MVTGVFAVLAVLVSSMVIYSTRGAKKSESAVKVRAELENAIARVERSLREAKAGTLVVNSTSINFVDQNNLPVSINCTGLSPNIRLLMNNQDLTGSNVNLTGCTLSYNESDHIVYMGLTAISAGSIGVESDEVRVNSQIVLRNY